MHLSDFVRVQIVVYFKFIKLYIFTQYHRFIHVGKFGPFRLSVSKIL